MSNCHKTEALDDFGYFWCLTLDFSSLRRIVSITNSGREVIAAKMRGVDVETDSRGPGATKIPHMKSGRGC